MGGGAGAGAMAQAAQYMRSVQRDLDRHLAMRAAMRAAYRDALRRGGSGYVPVVPRAEHSCFYLCLDCGHLADETSETCPACGHKGLLDLSFDIAADQVREFEAKRRQKSPLWLRIALVSTLVAATVTVGALTAGMLLPILVSLALSIPIYSLMLKPLTRLFARGSLRRPVRWRGPIHPASAPRSPSLKARGRVVGIDGLSSSPLTGRSCVAYEVAVKLRDPSSFRAESWLLHETHGESFAVGDVQIAAGRAALAMPLERIERGDIADDAHLEKFLRERGLRTCDGDLDLYEAILDEGIEAEVEVHHDPDVAVVSLPGASGWVGGRRRGPYR